jgi:hypothetical protein
MKLSPNIAALEQAYNALFFDATLASTRQQYAFDYRPRRPAHILPREWIHPTPPRFATTYPTMTRSTALESKEKLILLAAFQATYQNSITSLTPDMVPIVIDTGASISISPYASDFAGHIRPVQRVTLKGIASGLPVAGIGDIQYQFTNDEGEDQTITLRDYLHVPNCSIRLLCPRQIGVTTGNQTSINLQIHALL